jgi:hypothetical protein
VKASIIVRFASVELQGRHQDRDQRSARGLHVDVTSDTVHLVVLSDLQALEALLRALPKPGQGVFI